MLTVDRISGEFPRALVPAAASLLPVNPTNLPPGRIQA
jgi:hypothetical protein